LNLGVTIFVLASLQTLRFIFYVLVYEVLIANEHQRGSKGKGSLSLNIENVFEKGKDAELWISPSYYKTLEHLNNANVIYSKFSAFQSSNIFTYVNKQGEKGGIMYFELAPARPDLVLKDIIKMAHPKLLKEYEFTFYEKLK